MKNWKTLLLGIAMIANTSFAAPQVVDKVAAVVHNGVVLRKKRFNAEGPVERILCLLVIAAVVGNHPHAFVEHT